MQSVKEIPVKHTAECLCLKRILKRPMLKHFKAKDFSVVSSMVQRHDILKPFEQLPRIEMTHSKAIQLKVFLFFCTIACKLAISTCFGHLASSAKSIQVKSSDSFSQPFQLVFHELRKGIGGQNGACCTDQTSQTHSLQHMAKLWRRMNGRSWRS